MQSIGNLGLRIKEAFDWGFRSGYGEICIIGSDCFELEPEIILSGFEALGTHDAVLGPTFDGGYYLLGLRKMHEELFKNKAWGTDSVAVDTLADVRKLGLRHCLLETLNDIDVEQDLNGYKL